MLVRVEGKVVVATVDWGRRNYRTILNLITACRTGYRPKIPFLAGRLIDRLLIRGHQNTIAHQLAAP